MTTFNPPIVWVLTAAEIALGGLVVSWGYPVTGGVIMGLAAGAFVTRANIPWHVARLLRDAPTRNGNDD